MGIYFKNLETGKLQLSFDKADYMKLSDGDKKLVKSYFLWSKSQDCWVSKAKDSLWNVERIAKQIGLIESNPVGEYKPFAEQVEEKVEKANNRAERFSQLSDKFEEQSNEACRTSSKMLECLPMGQPILVGHHSEGKHRRHLEKSDNIMRKSVELSKKSEYYNDRAESSSNYAD